MCRGRRTRILLHLHIQSEGTALRGSRAGRRFGCRNHPSCVHGAHTYRGHASFSDTCGAWVGFGSGFGIGFTLLLTRSSPSRHPPFTQYPSPSRSLVRDGQTSPHKPRLVVPHSRCPSLSHSPPAHSFIIGPAVINTHSDLHHPGVLGSIPKREEHPPFWTVVPNKALSLSLSLSLSLIQPEPARVPASETPESLAAQVCVE
jgi:hypothetical protein